MFRYMMLSSSFSAWISHFLACMGKLSFIGSYCSVLVWNGLLSCKTVLSVFLLENSGYPKDWYLHSVCFRKGGEEGEKGVGGELANLFPLQEVLIVNSGCLE
ncbi:hypothetical protein H5410_035407 [Solanum commersonii]|uniref:Uncharacterized protein n=1 Tax=Solanum commersonii TaxID=4109 RepID=A0A9J5Y2T9_SOLCO|nr:hypothetical protein H5410_035407 [Solanum commersonii]